MNKKKKFLIVCQHYWPESFRINDIAEFLGPEKGHEVDVLCGIPNYPKGNFYDGYSVFSKRKQVRNGIGIRRVLEIPRRGNSQLMIFLNYISFPIFSLAHIPRLLLGNYDKILLYQLSPVMMSITGILVGKIRRIETTMYVLDLWPENLFSVLNIRNKIMRRVLTSVSHWHYRRADKLIVLSERMKEQLIKVTGKNEDRIIVLPQACEKLYEKNITDEVLENRFNKGFNIVYAGNISPAQSFGTIIDAAESLSRRGINDINWIIVGDGMSKEWVEQQVSKRGLSQHFHFEGQKPIHDIPRYTGIADVLIGCLVKSELLEATIPAKVMSYLAAGKPLILAMDGEVQHLVNRTIGCGYVGPAGDSVALANNINKVYSLPHAQRLKMGEMGQKYHFANFERNLILNKLLKFILN